MDEGELEEAEELEEARSDDVVSTGLLDHPLGGVGGPGRSHSAAVCSSASPAAAGSAAGVAEAVAQ